MAAGEFQGGDLLHKFPLLTGEMRVIEEVTRQLVWVEGCQLALRQIIPPEIDTEED